MGCMYCEENENLALLMAPICELPSSRVYLFRNQHTGDGALWRPEIMRRSCTS